MIWSKLRIAILIRALYQHWSRTPHSAPISNIIKAFLLVQVLSPHLCRRLRAKYTFIVQQSIEQCALPWDEFFLAGLERTTEFVVDPSWPAGGYRCHKRCTGRISRYVNIFISIVICCCRSSLIFRPVSISSIGAKSDPTGFHNSNSPGSHPSRAIQRGAIIGATIGGAFIIACLVIFLLRHRKKESRRRCKHGTQDMEHVILPFPQIHITRGQCTIILV